MQRTCGIRKKEIVKEELEFKFNDLKSKIYKSNVEIVGIKEFISNKTSLLNDNKAENEKLKAEIGFLKKSQSLAKKLGRTNN